MKVEKMRELLARSGVKSEKDKYVDKIFDDLKIQRFKGEAVKKR